MKRQLCLRMLLSRCGGLAGRRPGDKCAKKYYKRLGTSVLTNIIKMLVGDSGSLGRTPRSAYHAREVRLQGW